MKMAKVMGEVSREKFEVSTMQNSDLESNLFRRHRKEERKTICCFHGCCTLNIVDIREDRVPAIG